MHSAALAAGEPALLMLEKTRFRPSALARSLRVGPSKRTRGALLKDSKRAAVVLRPGMRQSEFRRVEVRMSRNHLSSLPIIIGANAKHAGVPDAPLCGLIVTGSDAVTHPTERAGLFEIVRDAMERDVPVLAISDAAPLALSAAACEPPRAPFQAVLIRDEVHGLAARADIDRAIDMMAAAPPR